MFSCIHALKVSLVSKHVYDLLVFHVSCGEMLLLKGLRIEYQVCKFFSMGLCFHMFQYASTLLM